ncbi:hypothetical protein E2C01_013436 [Portunus trituberculatus]|uniref:Uncharacterized protein n=1 Tax=Portunus trituberculatus TaxID=210409 RepID=A0A5B7DG92_PORTR|nr:hypothetical protein [Portunus trituberculatus]
MRVIPEGEGERCCRARERASEGGHLPPEESVAGPAAAAAAAAAAATAAAAAAAAAATGLALRSAREQLGPPAGHSAAGNEDRGASLAFKRPTDSSCSAANTSPGQLKTAGASPGRATVSGRRRHSRARDSQQDHCLGPETPKRHVPATMVGSGAPLAS